MSRKQYLNLLLRARHGDSESQLALAKIYAKETEDSSKANKWLLKAAEQNHSEAQLELGRYYYNQYMSHKDKTIFIGGEGRGYCQYPNPLYGKGNLLFYREEATKWLKKSSDSGNAQAECYLGVLDELTGNFKAALKHYLKSAGQGNAEAQCWLGYLYQSDSIGKRDDQEAIKWFRLSAKQKNAKAEMKLGDYYLFGKHVPKSHFNAIRLYNRSYNHGNKHALSRFRLHANLFDYIITGVYEAFLLLRKPIVLLLVIVASLCHGWTEHMSIVDSLLIGIPSAIFVLALVCVSKYLYSE